MADTEQLDERLRTFEHKLLARLQPAICALVQQTLESNQSRYAEPLQAQRDVLQALEAHQRRLEHTIQLMSHRPACHGEGDAAEAGPSPASREAQKAREQRRRAVEGVLRTNGKDAQDVASPPSSLASGRLKRTPICGALSCCRGSREGSGSPRAGQRGREVGQASSHSAEFYLGRQTLESFMTKRRCSGRVIASPMFELVSGCMIAANVFCMGVQTSIRMTLALESEPEEGHAVGGMLSDFEIIFFAYYLFEMLLKFHAYGPVKLFWKHSDHFWNVFDAILVATAGYDIFWDAMGHHGGGSNMSWLRLLRLLKMVKALRVVRVMRFFKELRVIMGAIMGGMQAYGWAMCIFSIIMYVWSLILMQGLTGYLNSIEVERSAFENIDDVLAIKADWGTIEKSMLTLFKSVCGGGGWSPHYTLIAATAGFPYDYLFLGYISFLVLAVLKLLTGIFVNQAREVANIDRNVVVAEMQEHKAMLANEFSDMFANFDDNEDGKVSLGEFKQHLANETMRTYFASLDLDPTDPERVWSIIDVDHRGALTQDEFISRLLVLRRDVRWMHVQHLEDLICDVYRLLETVVMQTSRIDSATYAGKEQPTGLEILTVAGEERLTGAGRELPTVGGEDFIDRL